MSFLNRLPQHPDTCVFGAKASTNDRDDIEFLARSKHRFRILEALSERPYERDELQQETDVSRTTIQRTLSDMEEMGWIESAGWRYKITELGDIIRSEFDRVLGVAGAVQELNQVIEWVPVEAIDIDLQRCDNLRRES